MCGISGILKLNPQNAVNKLSLRKINDALVHRGPDEQGIYTEKNLGLGSRRLSIIDLKAGRQPIHNEDKSLWIVFNGEIYNFPKLKNKLSSKGHKFYTKTDTEVILHLYEEIGEQCVNQLDGMFCFAIWDRRKKSLFLARDPLGQKPLHWLLTENEFIFASEIKAILAYPEVKREVNLESLNKYLFYGFIPAPATIFRNIRKLAAGSSMLIKENGEMKIKPYWHFNYSKKLKTSPKKIKEKVVGLFQEAVRKRLIADVPLGVFLSGGIDSGLVTALMSQLIPPYKVKTFSIGFREKNFDESRYAQKTAKFLKVKHELKIFSKKEVLNLLPKIADFIDEPMADPSILPTFLLSSFTKKKVKVALSGDGGDESFAGYPKYLAHYFLEKIPRPLTNNLKHLSSLKFLNKKWQNFFRYSSYPLYQRNQAWISPFSLKEVKTLTGRVVTLEDLERYHKFFKGPDPLDESFFLDQKLTLSDLYLVKIDRASMAASLEVRCPFLDKNLVRFCNQIPFRLKLKGFKTKSLLKEISLEYLPEEVVRRPKIGFGIPLEKWLKEDLRELVREELSFKKIKKEAFLDPEMVKKIMEKEDPHQIWTLLVFELWLKKWLKN